MKDTELVIAFIRAIGRAGLVSCRLATFVTEHPLDLIHRRYLRLLGVADEGRLPARAWPHGMMVEATCGPLDQAVRGLAPYPCVSIVQGATSAANEGGTIFALLEQRS